uniref:Putative secreted protein n=1 Tax=Anopheles darlingi TaxID=43151 RepID=A0A2M4DH82_ANODA
MLCLRGGFMLHTLFGHLFGIIVQRASIRSASVGCQDEHTARATKLRLSGLRHTHSHTHRTSSPACPHGMWMVLSKPAVSSTFPGDGSRRWKSGQ